MKKQIYQEVNVKQSKKIKDKITSGLEFPALFLLSASGQLPPPPRIQLQPLCH